MDKHMAEQYRAAVEHINHISKYGSHTGVECAAALLQEMGNPERKLKMIHVAGTNGKGSVCAYLSEILMQHGLKTAMFVSPHLVKINERIRINGTMITAEQFLEGFAVVEQAEARLLANDFGGITYFDFLFGIAVDWFAKEHVDVVVMETGLGGRLDSTNAVEHPILSVITSISLDHTDILGNTIEEIAAEKAGIIKAGVPVVYDAGNSASAAVIANAAAQKEALSIPVEETQWKIREIGTKDIDFLLNNRYYKSSVFSVHTPAVYQAANCSVALTAAAALKEHTDLLPQFDEELARQAVARTVWEGRMEEVQEGIYIDGAHNPDGIKNFLMTAAAMKKNTGQPMILLFSAVKDKKHDDMIAGICRSRIFDEFIVTQIGGARCLSAEEIEKEFQEHTDCKVKAFANMEDAFAYGQERAGKSCTLLCAGSLYLIGEIKSFIAARQQNGD